MEVWEQLIHISTDASWKATKFISNLKAHRVKYPGFDIARVAEYFATMEHKVQGAYAYRDIAEINKELKKIKFRTIAEQEVDDLMNARV